VLALRTIKAATGRLQGERPIIPFLTEPPTQNPKQLSTLVENMSQSFSTDLVPAADRQDAWVCNAKQICGDCRFEFPKRQPFHGSIERRVLAESGLTLFSSTPVAFAKFPVVEANARDRSCIIITQLKGTRRYVQAGSVALLQPGDSTIIDAGQPWSSDCPFPCARLYMRLPRWLVENRVGTKTLPLVPRIAGDCGLGVTLFRFATSLYEQANVLTPEEGVAALEAYLAILSGCIGYGVLRRKKQNHSADMLARIDHFVETHLADPALDPARIAAGIGVSVRHVHRLLHNRNVTVSGLILQRRLERCRTELADPNFSQRNITELAYCWGFSDSAHFSHRFKRQFGVSPREFRDQAQTRAWNETAERTLPHGEGLRLGWRN
jgi:AraC family transcriptional activator of tynA and feaB